MASSKVMEREREKNNTQRLEWIKYWTDYMKKNPNKVWSKQQADFINSVLRSSKAVQKQSKK